MIYYGCAGVVIPDASGSIQCSTGWVTVDASSILMSLTAEQVGLITAGIITLITVVICFSALRRLF